MLLEELDNQLSIITLAYEPFVKLELTSLEIQFDLI